MSEVASRGLDYLPTLSAFQGQVTRNYSGKTDTNIISIEVRLPEPVIVPRDDGKEARPYYQTMEVECYRNRSPEAFETLMNAPFGAVVEFKGARVRSQSASIKSWSKNLLMAEATNAEVKQVLVDKAVAEKANV